MLRLLLAGLTHSVYRLRVLGREHLPARGGALLVCNHLNYLDWLLLLAASRRPVRFLIVAGWARSGWPRRLLRWAGAVVTDGSDGPRGVVRAMRQAAERVNQGELVCLLAEDWRLPGGHRLSFRRCLERVARRARAPLVPVNVQQPYGSLFSLLGGRPAWRWPQTVPYPVEVGFGPPLPAATPAGEVRQAVQQLSADLALARNGRRRPVHRQFVRVAARHPFRVCFLDSSRPELVMRYGRICAGVLVGTRLLRPALGDAPMVAVWLPSSAGGAVANLILALLGKVSVNLNYTSSPEAVQSALRQCGCRHVLTSRRFTARVKLDPGPGVEMIYLEDLPAQVSKLRMTLAFLAVLLLPGVVLERWVFGLGRHAEDDLATVIFSSGSTGEPKGVMLTHGNVAANVESMLQATGLSSRDRALGVLPFFHSFGYTVTLWVPLQVGASAVYHADPRQAKEIGELCRKHRCTVYLSTATFLRFCLKKCDPGDFASLRLLVCGAEKLPQPLAQDFHKKFGVLPLEGYGCTELSPVVATNLPDKEAGGVAEVFNRPGTVGPPVLGVVGKVVHPETGERLPAGHEGLLLVHGANVMRGYLHRPEMTGQVLRDGWYVTGDMGHIDADGFITLTGRLSRFAKVGGEMVPLERIEEELHEVLGTSERVCAATCVPDEARGERLVVLYLAENLTQHGLEVRPWSQRLGGRGLPNLWLPSERDFYPVPEIPTLPSGKMDLRRVKAMALELAKK